MMHVFNGDLDSLQNNTISVICLAKDKGEEIDFERIEQISTKLTEVKHPNIVHYYSIVGNENQIVILMEKVQTDTLRNYLLTKPNRLLPEEDIKPIFTQLVSAVECLHGNNITHTNINLGNIFFDPTKNEAKLGDLLVCNRTSPLLRQNNSKDMTDYFFYAPEIWFNDQSYKPSFESDIWSLGVVLYIMACGRYPFFGRDRFEIYMSVKRGHLTFPKHLSKECQHLITTLMELEPKHRATIASIKSHVWLTTHGSSYPTSPVPLPTFPQTPSDQHEQKQRYEESDPAMPPEGMGDVNPGRFRKRSWSKDFAVNSLIENFMKQKEEVPEEEEKPPTSPTAQPRVKRSMSFSIDTGGVPLTGMPAFHRSDSLGDLNHATPGAVAAATASLNAIRGVPIPIPSTSIPSPMVTSSTAATPTATATPPSQPTRRHSFHEHHHVMEAKNPELQSLLERIKSEPPLRARDFAKVNIRTQKRTRARSDGEKKEKKGSKAAAAAAAAANSATDSLAPPATGEETATPFHPEQMAQMGHLDPSSLSTDHSPLPPLPFGQMTALEEAHFQTLMDDAQTHQQAESLLQEYLQFSADNEADHQLINESCKYLNDFTSMEL